MSITHKKKVSKTIGMRVILSLGLILLLSILCLSLLRVSSSSQTQLPASDINNHTSKIDEKPDVVEYILPQRIEIPSLSVIAPVVEVGLTQDNDMDVDDDIAKTAWYKLGPKPGEKGSAVIAGHYGLKDGEKAVFSDLRGLNPGDSILVYGENDRKLTFIVREIRTYVREADATEVFRSSDGKAHLNLITCDGSWNSSLQTYSDRLVVFTDLKLDQ